MHLSDDDRRLLLQIARSSIDEAARGREWQRLSVPDSLKTPCGAFVTLRQEGELRGCIGFVEAKQPLYLAVAEVAEKAAMEDPRFPPLAAGEVGMTDIEISVLSELTPVTDIRAIEIGKHGLVLEAGWARGLLLPQVAVEYGWDREEFLDHTARKAGLPPEAWRTGKVKKFMFTTDTFSESELLQSH